MKYRLLKVTTTRFSFVNKITDNTSYELKPIFNRKINKVDESKYEICLSIKLAENNEKPNPFDIDLEIVGAFELSDGTEEDINQFTKVNAVAILFPYLRSTLSSLMSSMMVTPIVLPIINAADLFK